MDGINADYECDPEIWRHPHEWAELLERIPLLEVRMLMKHMEFPYILTTELSSGRTAMSWQRGDMATYPSFDADTPGWFIYGVRNGPPYDEGE